MLRNFARALNMENADKHTHSTLECRDGWASNNDTNLYSDTASPNQTKAKQVKPRICSNLGLILITSMAAIAKPIRQTSETAASETQGASV